MTTDNDKPSDGYGFARPGSRLEEVMRRRGAYIPQSLIQDFEESLRLISVESGAQEGELRDLKIVPSAPYQNFPYSLEIWHRGMHNDTPAPLVPLCAELEAHVRGRKDILVNNGGRFTRISGYNFKDILQVLNDGFVKPHDPEANIDVDGKMSPSWVERSGQGEGQGGGVGSPG